MLPRLQLIGVFLSVLVRAPLTAGRTAQGLGGGDADFEATARAGWLDLPRSLASLSARTSGKPCTYCGSPPVRWLETSADGHA